MSSSSGSDSANQVRSLMAKKGAIEADIEAQLSILKANSCTMHTPLVDAEGFPRDDIDVYAVRGARVRIIGLRNDLKALMDEVAKSLETVYPPNSEQNVTADPNSETAAGNATNVETPAVLPFAKVDGVAPGGPAAEAGLQRDDLIIRFGHLTRQSFSSSSLSPLADVVAANENRSLPIVVLRGSTQVVLGLTPYKNWGGRGMLGCHIVPYSAQ